MQIESLPLRLEDVVSQAVELVRPLHTNPAMSLVCHWSDASLLGARGQLRGDALRLQQVLVHLLSNAIKLTAVGRVTLVLAAQPTDDGGRVPLVIAVQDGSIGMSAEQVTALLQEPDPGKARTGLGLILSRRLVELMGGRLDVQSHAALGNRFEIRLTLPQDATAVPPAPLKPRRLLLADGNVDSRLATQSLLSHLGLSDGGVATSVDVASTLGALDAARHAGRGFDWLLLDGQLPGPGPTGPDLLARLRRDHPTLRIAVLSAPDLGDAFAQTLAQARAFGARALCQQPLLPGRTAPPAR